MESLRNAMEDYQASLSDLTFNSKPHINALTMLAEEDMEYAEQIVKLIEARLNEVTDDGKLPVMYLMDSIVKNVGGNYKPHFARNLVRSFLQAFRAGSDKTKMSLYKLRSTWDDYFPLKRLYELDNEIKKLDPNWPIKDLPAHLHDKQTKTIHVNPKFLEISTGDATSTIIGRKATSPVNTDLTQDLINKQKQLLELQSQKLMLELEQTKQQLAMRERRQQIQKKAEGIKDPRSKIKPDMKRDLDPKVDSIPAKSKKLDVGNKTQRINKNKSDSTKKSPEAKSKKSPPLKAGNKLANKPDNPTAPKTTKVKISKSSNQSTGTPEKEFTRASSKNIKELNKIPKKKPNHKESPVATKKGLKVFPQNPANKRSISPGQRLNEDDRKRERISTKSSEGSESPRFSSESESDNGKHARGWRASKRPRPQPRENRMHHTSGNAEFPPNRRLSIEESIEIPQELNLSHQQEILHQADRQLRSGQLTHEQHQEMLLQLHQIFELQNQRNTKEHFGEPNMDFRQRENFGRKDSRQRRGNMEFLQGAGSKIPSRDPRRNKKEAVKQISDEFVVPNDKSMHQTDNEPLLEEPEDYIIASMTPSSEAYQKHSLSLRRSSTEDKAYLEHKKKIMVSKYNKQLNPENSSGVESEDKDRNDISSDNSATKETKEVITSPTLPLKKRKYKSSENDSESNSVVSVDQNKSEESSNVTESEMGEENNEQYLPDIIRSMTPPPLPDLNEITEFEKKTRSSSLPLEENTKFKQRSDQTRKKKKYRHHGGNDLDDDSQHESTPELQNSQERSRSLPKRDQDEDQLYNQLMMEEKHWEHYEMEQRRQLQIEQKDHRPFKRHNRGRGFRGDHFERRGARIRGRGRGSFRLQQMGPREHPGLLEHRDRFGPMGPGDRLPLRREHPGPGWEDGMHWDGPPMRRNPNMPGINEPPIKQRPSARSFSPPRLMHPGRNDRGWHDDRGRRGVPPREWDGDGHLEYRPQHFPEPRDRPPYRPIHADHHPHEMHREPMRSEMDRNSPADQRHSHNMPPPRNRTPSPKHFHAAEEPPPAEINQLNVNKLLNDLQSMGILPGQRSIKPEKLVAKPNSRPQSPVVDPAVSASANTSEPDKPSIEDELLNMNPDTELPQVNINNLEDLKIRRNEIINRLYTGIQCSACGMRFTARQTDVYAEHLDWHYRLNRKDKEGNVQSHREFYPTAGGWIMYEEIDDPLKRNKSQVFDETAEEEESSKATPDAIEDMEENTVPATGKENEDICKVCKEPFETIYNEDEDEWQFINCVKVNDETFHPHCYGDHQSSCDEIQPLPTPVRVPLFNPLAEAQVKEDAETIEQPMQSIKLELTANSPENSTKSPINTETTVNAEEIKPDLIAIKTEKIEEPETVEPEVELESQSIVAEADGNDETGNIADSGDSADHNNAEGVSNLNLDENKISDSVDKSVTDVKIENNKLDSPHTPNQIPDSKDIKTEGLVEAQDSEMTKPEDNNTIAND